MTNELIGNKAKKLFNSDKTILDFLIKSNVDMRVVK